MLTFDLAGLSRTDLEEAVSCHCSQFGSVISVSIVPRTEHRDYSIAVVLMSSAEEADRVVVKVGDMKFGGSAIIRLVQEERQVPVSLRRGVASGPNVSAQIAPRSVSHNGTDNSAVPTLDPSE